MHVPTAFDEAANMHIEAKPAAELAGAAGIGAQSAALDQHWRLHFDRFDAAIAHIALAHRDRRGFAVLGRPTAPAAALDALDDESLAGLRVAAEEHHRGAERAEMRRGNAVFRRR